MTDQDDGTTKVLVKVACFSLAGTPLESVEPR
jgi:hypothetical protein